MKDLKKKVLNIPNLKKKLKLSLEFWEEVAHCVTCTVYNCMPSQW